MPPDCPMHQPMEHKLDRIESKLDDIIKRLSDGDKVLAVQELKVTDMQRVVYGACGLILLAVLGGLIKLVVNG